MPDPSSPVPQKLALAQIVNFLGQPGIRWAAPNGDTATVALHGGQLLSWVADGRERFYLSPQAVFNGQAAIRGGVPLCFPQFNQRGPLAKHGFARHLRWSADEPVALPGATRLSLHLRSFSETLAWWPHAFALQLDITLGNGWLRLELDVQNTGAADTVPWDFTTALHSYLRVDDITQVRLSGLDAHARWDSVQDHHSVQTGDVVIAGEYDSVFNPPGWTHDTTPPAVDLLHAPEPAALVLHDGSHALRITQSASLPTSVVWNPGEALCAQLDDMPNDGWKQMVCVEAAQIDQAVPMGAGARWNGWQAFEVLPPVGTAAI